MPLEPEHTYNPPNTPMTITLEEALAVAIENGWSGIVIRSNDKGKTFLAELCNPPTHRSNDGGSSVIASETTLWNYQPNPQAALTAITESARRNPYNPK